MKKKLLGVCFFMMWGIFMISASAAGESDTEHDREASKNNHTVQDSVIQEIAALAEKQLPEYGMTHYTLFDMDEDGIPEVLAAESSDGSTVDDKAVFYCVSAYRYQNNELFFLGQFGSSMKELSYSDRDGVLRSFWGGCGWNQYIFYILTGDSIEPWYLSYNGDEEKYYYDQGECIIEISCEEYEKILKVWEDNNGSLLFDKIPGQEQPRDPDPAVDRFLQKIGWSRYLSPFQNIIELVIKVYSGVERMYFSAAEQILRRTGFVTVLFDSRSYIQIIYEVECLLAILSILILLLLGAVSVRLILLIRQQKCIQYNRNMMTKYSVAGFEEKRNLLRSRMSVWLKKGLFLTLNLVTLELLWNCWNFWNSAYLFGDQLSEMTKMMVYLYVIFIGEAILFFIYELWLWRNTRGRGPNYKEWFRLLRSWYLPLLGLLTVICVLICFNVIEAIQGIQMIMAVTAVCISYLFWSILFSYMEFTAALFFKRKIHRILVRRGDKV